MRILRAAAPLLIVCGLACSDLPEEGSGGNSAPLQLSSLDSLVNEGESTYRRSQFDSAQTFWRSALLETERVHDTAGQARVLTSLGLAAWRTGAYGDARSLGERALSIKLAIGLTGELFRSYNALGLLAWNEGRLADAATLFDRAIEVARSTDDVSSLAKAANNMALVYTELGDFAAARAGFISAREAGRQLADATIEGRSLNNLGMLEIQLGNPSAALEALGEARRLYRTIEDRTGEQNALGQMGTAYDALGEPHLALAAMDSALGLAREQGLRQEEASNLELLAGVYRQTGNLPRALQLYQEANLLNAELGLEVERGTNLRNSAEIHAALGRIDLAVDKARQALVVHQTTGARFQELRDLLLLAELAALGERPGTEIEAQLAAARRLGGLINARVARVEVALAAAAIADRQRHSERVLRLIREVRDELIGGGYHSQTQAATLRARAFNRLDRLDSAAAAGREAVAAVERVRSRFASAVFRTAFGSEKMEPYEDLIEILIRDGRIDEAFEVADGARSRALVEHLATSASDGALPRTVRALTEGETVLRRIDTLISRLDLMEEIPPAERGPNQEVQAEALAAELASVREEYESMLLQVAERDASGSALLGGQRVKAAEVQQALRSGELLLEYFVMPSRIIAFAVSSETVRTVSVEILREDLAGRVRVARDLVGRRVEDPALADGVLTGLHELLIAPLQAAGLFDGVQSIIVIPHSALVYLPFAALKDGKAARYLIQDFTLMSFPSASALAVLRSGQPAARSVSAEFRPVILAPFPETLPGSASETRAVRRTLPDPVVITGRRATEPRFREALASSGLVHVATHGVMNPRNPMFSRIELAPGLGGRQDDARLEVHEVLALRVNAPLVFLSGCETGVGAAWSTQYARGEDYATLAQAFLYAGARSVISTLWSIEDQGAAELAARFYRGLETADPASALARAQRDMLATRKYSNPYFWAGYQLTGEPGTVTGAHQAGRFRSTDQGGPVPSP